MPVTLRHRRVPLGTLRETLGTPITLHHCQDTPGKNAENAKGNTGNANNATPLPNHAGKKKKNTGNAKGSTGNTKGNTGNAKGSLMGP